jgi:hypothetical protein
MRITDRSKDVIKSGGEWISSIDIENLAIGHPKVAEAAVIGVRHTKWDERPLLVLVLKPGVSATREEIFAFMQGKIASWWMPDEIVFVDGFRIRRQARFRRPCCGSVSRISFCRRPRRRLTRNSRHRHAKFRGRLGLQDRKMTTLNATVSTAQTSMSARSPMARFLGRGAAFWRLLARGAVMLMFTLGIYRFWLHRHPSLSVVEHRAADEASSTPAARELLLGS